MRTPLPAGSSRKHAAGAAALHQVTRPLSRTAASLEPSVAISVAAGPGDSALIARHRRIGEGHARLRGRWRRKHLHLASVERDGKTASGRQHSAVIVALEAPHLRGRAAVEAQNGGGRLRCRVPCRRWRDLPAPRSCASVSAFSSIWLGFSAPSNDGTVMVASPRPSKRSAKSLQGRDHGSSPSACRTGRSSDRHCSSLYRPIRLFDDAAEIEIAAMLAHRGDHRMVLAAAGPRTIPGSRPLVELDDAAGVDVREQPFVDRHALAHAMAEARHLPGEIERRAAHADHRQPVVAVRGEVDVVGVARQVVDHHLDVPFFGPSNQ